MTKRPPDTLAAHPELKAQIRTFVADYGHLTIDLLVFKGGVPILRKHRRQICRDVLDVLSPACELMLVYNLNESDRHIRKLRVHFTKRHGRHELDLLGKSWSDFDKLLYRNPLLSSICQARGTILLRCRASEVPWAEILRACYDPTVVGNLSSSTGKAPLQFARRHCDGDRCSILLDQSNSGLESLTVVADGSCLLPIFDVAARSCSLTGWYLIMAPTTASNAKTAGSGTDI